MSSLRLRAVVAASALAIALPVMAQGGPSMGRGDRAFDRGMKMERLFDRLDLSVEQRERIEAAYSQHRVQTAAQREELKQARDSLSERIHAPELDEAAIREAAAAVAAVEVELTLARASLVHQVRQELTPEQQQQFEQILERRRSFRESARDGSRRSTRRPHRRGGF